MKKKPRGRGIHISPAGRSNMVAENVHTVRERIEADVEKWLKEGNKVKQLEPGNNSVQQCISQKLRARGKG